MKNLTKKSMISLILTLIMIFNILPIGIFTTEVFAATTVNSKADFFAALLDPTISEIKLGTDIEITNTDYNDNYTFYTNSINRTLDLNGHTLTINKSLGSEYGLVVRAKSTGKTATITNSKSTGGIVNNSGRTPIAAFVYGTDGTEVILKIDGLNLTTKSSSLPFFTSSSSVNSKLIVTNSEIDVTGSSNYDFIRSAEFNNVSLSNMKITRTNTGGIVKIDFSSDSKKVVDVIPSDSEILYDTESVTFTDSTLLNEISVTSDGASSIIIRKKSATPTQHTVTFVLNGGTMAGTNPVMVDDGGKVTPPANPTRTGYYFEGWYKESTFNNRFEFTTETISGDTSIYAKWLPKVVGMNLKADGIEKNGLNYKLKVNSLDVVFHEDATPVTIDTKNVSELYVDFPTTTPLTTVPVKGQTYYFGVDLRAGNDTKPNVLWDDAMKTGSVATVTGANVNFKELSRSPGSGSAMVFFEYTEPIAQHTVTFINGLDNSTISTTTVDNNEKITRPSNPTPPANYLFDNWYSDASFTTPFDFTNTLITADTPIYANFVTKKQVTLYVNKTPAIGGKVSVTTSSTATPTWYDTGMDYGTPVGVGGTKLYLHAKANDNYKFVKWTKDGATVSTSEMVEINLTADKTEYTYIAEFALDSAPTERTVKFMDGSTELTSLRKTVNNGETISEPAGPDKTGHRFVGWYADHTCNIPFNFTEPIITDTTIYAKYVEQFNITVEYNGGKNNGFTPMPLDKGTVLNRSDIESSLNSSLITPPTDKEFDYLEIDGSKWTESTYKLNSNITIKIVWKDIIKYTARFDLNGGTGKNGFTPMDQEVDEDFESLIPTWDELKDFIKAPFGKVYIGVEINGEKVNPGVNYKPTKDVTIKLLWEDKYKILDGANQTYTIFSGKDIVIKASGDKANLTSITMDGTAIDTKKYNTVNGSTILTLKSSYLDTVAPGSHKIGFVYGDGSVETGLTIAVANSGEANDNEDNNLPGSTNTENNTNNATISKTPKTGDNITLWIVLLLVATFGLVGTVKYLRKRD